MPPSRSNSDPYVPPAKAHPLPQPKDSPAPAALEDRAAPQPSAPAQAGEAHITPLHQIDQEIAAEADRLLDGHIDESSLDDDFAADTRQVGPDDADDMTADTRSPSIDDEAEVAAVEIAHMQVEADAEVERSEAAVPAQQEKAPSEAQTEVVIEPEAHSRTEPEAERDDAADSADEPPEAGEAAVTVIAANAGMGRALSMTIAAMVTLLMFMNFPLRFLPETAKTIFNWFALSLLFWVPAVWFLAIFVVGG